MAKLKVALTYVKEIKEALEKLPAKKDFPDCDSFFSDIELVKLEISRLESRIEDLKISPDATIRWNCDIPLKLTCITSSLLRSAKLCKSADLLWFSQKMTAVLSGISQLN